MNWYKLTVHTVTDAVEAISYRLEEMGVSGVEIFDPKDILMQKKSPLDWDYIDEDLLKDLARDEVLLSVYLSEDDYPSASKLSAFKENVHQAVLEVSEYLPTGSGDMDLTVLREEDWANNWKNYYKPFHIGSIYVVPSWIDDPGTENDKIIRMDPGMAFGSGTHDTTSMCVSFLEEQMHGGETVFDVGCGSGILGIAAAKLGAGKVLCSDLDPNAIPVAIENTERNEVADVVSVYEGDLLAIPELKANTPKIIVANIIADVIIGFCPDVFSVLPEGGLFISSGILNERCEDVEKALKAAGFSVREVKHKGNWSAILSEKKGN